MIRALHQAILWQLKELISHQIHYVFNRE